MQREPRYRAYLLRLWRPDRDNSSTWRASLQEPLSEERIGFGSLDALLAFLRCEITGAETREQTPTRDASHKGGAPCPLE